MKTWIEKSRRLEIEQFKTEIEKMRNEFEKKKIDFEYFEKVLEMMKSEKERDGKEIKELEGRFRSIEKECEELRVKI